MHYKKDYSMRQKDIERRNQRKAHKRHSVKSILYQFQNAPNRIKKDTAYLKQDLNAINAESQNANYDPLSVLSDIIGHYRKIEKQERQKVHRTLKAKYRRGDAIHIHPHGVNAARSELDYTQSWIRYYMWLKNEWEAQYDT